MYESVFITSSFSCDFLEIEKVKINLEIFCFLFSFYAAQILFIFVLISFCSAYPVYVPIQFDKYPGYEFGYSWPVYKSITKYDSSAAELKDYWLTFKAEFDRSYKEITKPFIVERAVPIPVPGNHSITSEISFSNLF